MSTIKPQIGNGNKAPTVSIHMAAEADAPAITALAQEMADDLQYESLCNAETVRRLLRRDNAPECTLLTARADEDIVGFVLFYPGYDLTSDADGYHIADIAVAGAWRGRGVGKRLMAALGQRARAEKREWLSLTLLQHNHKARGFYESLGFQFTGAELWATGKSGILSIINASLNPPC